MGSDRLEVEAASGNVQLAWRRWTVDVGLAATTVRKATARTEAEIIVDEGCPDRKTWMFWRSW
jgi:hypothetical protein